MPQDSQELRVRSELLVLQVLTVSRDPPVSLDPSVPSVNPDRMEVLVSRVSLELRVRLGQLVLLAHKVSLVQQGHKVKQVIGDRLDQPETGELLGLMEMLAHRVPQDQTDRLGQEVSRGRLEHPALQGTRDHLVQPDKLVNRETVEQLALLVQMDPSEP